MQQRKTGQEAKMFSLVLLFLLQPMVVDSLNFSFSSFDPSSCDIGSNLICWGSVNANNGTLNITPEPPEEESEVGRVLFRYPLTLWPASFSTTFTIRILSNSKASGDGMAFVIAQDNKPSPPESYGSFIGIMDTSTEGVLQQLAVELDTYKNPHDIDKNHVAIDTASVEYPDAVRSLSSVGINLKSGRNITVKIEYDGLGKILHIFVAYAGYPLMNILSHKILMQETVPQQAYVGFTASTGYFWEVHQVLDWNFTLYQLPDDTLNHGSNHKYKKVLRIVVPTVVVLSVALLLFLRVQWRRRVRIERRDDIEVLTEKAAHSPKIFTYKQLARATRNFSKENLLGFGGSGSVYKGIISTSNSPTVIAVKKINATSSQGEKEYLAEICTIGLLRHKNLVQLQGWCHEREQLLLVYEFMSNGSLDQYIGRRFLDWKTRKKILSGLALGLLYLHEECDNPVVHRDVKPNNVMLDSEYNAHLGDFGLARLLDQNNSSVTTMVAGTIGYLAPEVSFTGRATPESDVYSFGMVVLEVVCGRRTKGMMEEYSLVEWVWEWYEKGKLVSCVDKKLGLGDDELEEEEVKRLAMVGLACVHPDPMLRPRMRKVVQVFLNRHEPLMKMADTRPTHLCLSLPSSSTTMSSTITATTQAYVEDMTVQM